MNTPGAFRPRIVSVRIEGERPANSNQTRRLHRMQNAKDAAFWRQQGRTLALDARNKAGMDAPFDRAIGHFFFQYRTRHRRDPMNALESLKPFMDGLVGVLLTDDDFLHFNVGNVSGEYGTDADVIVITLEEAF